MTLPDALHLEIQEEAFSDGAVPAVSFAAPAADEAVAGQQALLRLAGILPPCPNGRSIQAPARAVRRKIQQPATGILKQKCLDIYVHLSAGASVLPLGFCCPICGQKFFLK